MLRRHTTKYILTRAIIIPVLSTHLTYIIYGTFIHNTYAKETTASYSPGARSSTTANTMLDSVVGNRHSRIKNQTAATGEIYHVASDGTVTAPNGLVVNKICQAPTNKILSSPHSKYRFQLGRHDQGFETVTIGVSTEPAPVYDKSKHSPTIRRATMSASFAPTGLYVLPLPCQIKSSSDRALTMDAASALASADGNIFTLAGNRSTLHDADTANTLPNGDIQLSSTSEQYALDEALTP